MRSLSCPQCSCFVAGAGSCDNCINPIKADPPLGSDRSTRRNELNSNEQCAGCALSRSTCDLQRPCSRCVRLSIDCKRAACIRCRSKRKLDEKCDGNDPCSN